jgi:hypothetical protein
VTRARGPGTAPAVRAGHSGEGEGWDRGERRLHDAAEYANIRGTGQDRLAACRPSHQLSCPAGWARKRVWCGRVWRPILEKGKSILAKPIDRVTLLCYHVINPRMRFSSPAAICCRKHRDVGPVLRRSSGGLCAPPWHDRLRLAASGPYNGREDPPPGLAPRRLR